jgi:hypothetical protein
MGCLFIVFNAVMIVVTGGWWLILLIPWFMFASLKKK